MKISVIRVGLANKKLANDILFLLEKTFDIV